MVPVKGMAARLREGGRSMGFALGLAFTTSEMI
jgi:hypothetical protein